MQSMKVYPNIKGLYRNHLGWYHQTSSLGKTYRDGPAPCPVIVYTKRISIRLRTWEELQKPYTFRCLDCPPDAPLVTKVFGKNRKKFKRCDYHRVERNKVKTRESRKRRIEMYGDSPPLERDLVIVKHDIKDRICLSCDKSFKSLGVGNRICCKCNEGNEEYRSPHKLLLRG